VELVEPVGHLPEVQEDLELALVGEERGALVLVGDLLEQLLQLEVLIQVIPMEM